MDDHGVHIISISNISTKRKCCKKVVLHEEHTRCDFFFVCLGNQKNHLDEEIFKRRKTFWDGRFRFRCMTGHKMKRK